MIAGWMSTAHPRAGRFLVSISGRLKGLAEALLLKNAIPQGSVKVVQVYENIRN
jgi:hypothetical protein